MDDGLFWRSTPYETRLVMEAIADRRQSEAREAALRVGLVAAAVYNVNRGRGGRVFRPQDFVRTAPKVVSAEELEAALDAWASSHNARKD